MPISIRKLRPIQLPSVDMDGLKRGRKAFTKEEWLDILMRSTGMEPDELTEREKWLLLTRMIPLVENNFNLCNLGHALLANPIYIKKYRRTVFSYRADRLRSPTCSTIWAERRWV